MVVIDPRRTATAQIADLYLPVAPGGDIALLNAVGRMLLLMGASDQDFVGEHTEGFEEYRRFLLEQDLGELCAAAGLREEELYRLARLLAGAGRFLSFRQDGGDSHVGSGLFEDVRGFPGNLV